MRDPDVDEPRLLAAGDHFDRETERAARLAQELWRIFRQPQGVGSDRAHRLLRQPAQTLTEAPERLQRVRLGGAVDAFFGCKAGAEPYHLAQRIEGVDLAVDDPSDLEMEAVGAQVDRSQEIRTGHQVKNLALQQFRGKPRVAFFTLPKQIQR